MARAALRPSWKTPGATSLAQADALGDLTVLTGGQPVLEAAGDTPETLGPEHLGFAWRAWLDKNYLSIRGGRGDTRNLRDHIAVLQSALGTATDPVIRKGLRDRIGRLNGGLAILYTGGSTTSEIEALRYAVSSALLALTVEAVVYRKVPELALRPDGS